MRADVIVIDLWLRDYPCNPGSLPDLRSVRRPLATGSTAAG